jgi:hypothetical protein
MKRIFIILPIFALFLNLAAQSTNEDGIRIIGRNNTYDVGILNGDTVCVLQAVYCFPYKNKKEYEKYWKLVRNIKKVYPYAKLANYRLKQLNDNLSQISTERGRKAYVKVVEEQMKAEFKEDLMKLTISQGRILIKLIDRETGNTSYQLVKELRGTFTAFFWQGIARIFGNNLKDKYDANGDDKMIEDIIKRIDRGQI